MRCSRRSGASSMAGLNGASAIRGRTGHAVVLFGAFAWAELVFNEREVPAQLALLIVGYSVITWAGMAIFGRSVWLSRGDPFATVFGLLARLAPLELSLSNVRWCGLCEGS